MRKADATLVLGMLVVLATTGSAAQEQPVAVETFDERTPTASWLPTRAKEGWTANFQGDARTAIGPAYGKSGNGMALFRPRDAWNAMTWYPEGGVTPEANTLRFSFRISKDGGVSVCTWRKDGKGLSRITASADKGIVRWQNGSDVLLSAAEFKPDTWYTIEFQHDFSAGKYRARLADGDWKGPAGQWGYFMKKRPADGIESVSFAASATPEGEAGCCVDDLAILTAAGAAPQEEWVKVFEDPFDRDKLGPDWAVLDGDFKPAYDAPNGIGTLYARGEAVILRRFPGDVRVEMEASTQEPCDLSVLLCTNDQGYRGGYFLGFGSNDNALSKMLRLGKKVAISNARITSGKKHRLVAEKVGPLVTLSVDGEEVLRYEDDKPLGGETHEMVGLYFFKPAAVDYVKVFGRKGRKPVTLAELPTTTSAGAQEQEEKIARPAGNLVANPSFEDVRPGIWPRLPASWVPEYSGVGDRPTLVKDARQAHSGDRFLRLAGKGKWMKIHALGPDGGAPTIEAGKTYALSAWARRAGAGDASIEIQPSDKRFGLTPEWREYEVKWEAAKDLAKYNTGFFLKAYGAVDVDDVVVREEGVTVTPPATLKVDRTKLRRLPKAQAWDTRKGEPIPDERITVEVTNVTDQSASGVLISLPLPEVFGQTPAYDFVSTDKVRVVDATTGKEAPFALLEKDLRPGLTPADQLVFVATVPPASRKSYDVYLADRAPVGKEVFAPSQLPKELGKRADAPEGVFAETTAIERIGTLHVERANGKVILHVTAPAGSTVSGRVQGPDRSSDKDLKFKQEGEAPVWSAEVGLPDDAAKGIWSVDVDLTLPDGAKRAVTGAFVNGAGIWAAGNLRAVRSDDAPQPNRAEADLFAARGERESFQVVIASQRPLPDVALEASALRHVGGDARIPADQWALDRVVELYVGIVHPSPALRQVGGAFVNAGNYPDPLLPWRSHDVEAGTQQVCLATLRVPRDAPAGDYRGAITASAADGTRLVLPVKLHVYDFEMPERASFPILISARNAYVSVPRDREGRFGKDVDRYHLWDREASDALPPFVAEKWLEPAISGVLRAGALPWTYDEKTREVLMDFSRFDENVGRLLDECGVRRVYTIGWQSGWHRPGRIHTFPPLDAWPARWGTAYKESPGRITKHLNTKEGLRMLEDWAAAVGKHLEEKGWLDRVSFYIFDEPKSEEVSETILETAKAMRRGHPGLLMWGAGYGHMWRPYFEYLDLFTGQISGAVREKMKAEGRRYLGTYNQTIDILPVPRTIALYGASRGWDGYYHHETTTNQDPWINPEPPVWGTRYTPKFVAGEPHPWMLLAGTIYHWPVDELGEPLPEGKERAWASSLRIEALRESAEDAEYLMMLRDLAREAPEGSPVRRRLDEITSQLQQVVETGRVPVSHNRYYNYRLDEDALTEIRRALCEAVEQARQQKE